MDVLEMRFGGTQDIKSAMSCTQHILTCVIPYVCVLSSKRHELILVIMTLRSTLHCLPRERPASRVDFLNAWKNEEYSSFRISRVSKKVQGGTTNRVIMCV